MGEMEPREGDKMQKMPTWQSNGKLRCEIKDAHETEEWMNMDNRPNEIKMHNSSSRKSDGPRSDTQRRDATWVQSI